jgi:DNA polymerase
MSSRTYQYSRVDSYGGMLTENIAQAIARDILAEAMLRLEAAGYSLVLTVHDEAIAEVDINFGSVDTYRELMIQVPTWATGLPIDAEVINDTRYTKS